MTHQHAAAFCMIEYAAADESQREVIWNSRDGLPPSFILSRETGQPLLLKDRLEYQSRDRQ
jgi:hypothetical protein